MLKNTAAYSIRDEIGTCPNFEVKLELRDNKPFFVRHTIFVKTRNLLYRKKWIGWKNWELFEKV